MSVITKRSVCPFDCPDTCGMLVEVEGGKAVSVKGDPLHPFSRGTLCPKMRHYEESVHSPLRLTTPLKRTGAKGSGEFAPISWEEAVATIASRWRAIIAEHGAEAILPYSYAGTMGIVQRNAGHPFFHRLGASRLDRTICSPAKGAGWQAVMGQTATPPPETAGKSDLLILWGINAAATSIHFLNQAKEVQAKGGTVWLIDTYETPTASAADRTFLVRPGSDGALALGIMHILAREGLTDMAFLDSQVLGYEELKREVLPLYPPAVCSRITGLAVEEIELMARFFASARAPFIRLGSALSRYGNGAMTVRTICCLPALVGAYGKEGAGCFPDTATGAAFPMGLLLREDLIQGSPRLINMNQLGQALNELSDPPVMGLYVYHSNPAAVTPDQNAVLKGLARENLFTVVHERFMTDTARYADIVLPATSSLEHSDIYRSYGTYCIQRAQGAIDPVGESKSNWEVFSLLAAELGFQEELFNLSADQVIDRLLAVPTPLRQGIDEEALAAGLPVELAAREGGYRTTSGKIEILNRQLAHPLPVYLPTHEENGTLPFRLMTAPNPYALNATFYEREELRARQGGMQLRMNPADAAAKGLADGERVVAWNALGEVTFLLKTTDKVPACLVVAEGVWWLAYAPGSRSVNALTSQRLTDEGGGSTFYDNRVDVRREL
ncbi:molybdopterin-binding iron-sulfur cluster-binding oxidoreductase MopB-3 [Citrifermentans bemidjiense Bem]|uniref:Molybdopterin-binding iron-sulfur cluster-binding oxidoreductase MopB-3 n=1 Tax=Citrifermentans bemidjiense (strain ATCC BAA-1014 / DSM 16622 / JCM 12645 / Bem) TaxID=404380 RepID=B5EE01_CITBB|nr:molybdopterin oxidoreductase family protein [Citrifermentans bemidjiense]ACH37739.1 molybdopterin-binding iron-sulfur cluster-binding oxidoreductase MopB-3 [Citrifermentans bemidjiense Bem]